MKSPCRVIKTCRIKFPLDCSTLRLDYAVMYYCLNTQCSTLVVQYKKTLFLRSSCVRSSNHLHAPGIRLNLDADPPQWCIYPPRARLSSCPSLTTKRHLVNIPPSSKPLLSQQFRPPQAPRLNKKSVGFILFRPVDVTETISILKYTLQPFIRSGR